MSVRSGRDRIVLCHRTLETATFAERAEAAAAAGFEAIGVSAVQYRAYRAAGETDADMVAATRLNGVRVEEIAALYGAADDGFDAARRALPRFLALAEVFGAAFLGAHSGYDGDLGRAADRFGRVCDEVAGHGLTVGLEFVPFTTLPDLRTAAAIVAAAGRPNAGIVIDTWHYFRGAPQFDDLAALDPAIVAQIQITDGWHAPRCADPLEDTVRHRRLPGEGEFDLGRFVRAVDAVGPDVPWSIESPSDAQFALPPHEGARRAMDATRSLLARARREEVPDAG